jgi:ribosome-binding factor A
VGDEVRRELARLLRGTRDPRIGFVTITEVELSPDLRSARVHFSTIEGDPDETLAGLRQATPFLRRGLARTAGLRFTPRLQFVLDPSMESGMRVQEILDSLSEADEEEPAAEPPREPE